MKRYKLLGLLAILLLILGCNQNVKSNTNTDIQAKKDKSSTQNVAKFIDERLNRIVNNKDGKVMVSSNPYTYIQASKKDYNEIVKVGEPALNYLLGKLANSSSDGLDSWIMASLCSDILGPKYNFQSPWSSGKDWYEKYMRAKEINKNRNVNG